LAAIEVRLLCLFEIVYPKLLFQGRAPGHTT
jgi:hypothetical protein